MKDLAIYLSINFAIVGGVLLFQHLNPEPPSEPIPSWVTDPDFIIEVTPEELAEEARLEEKESNKHEPREGYMDNRGFHEY